MYLELALAEFIGTLVLMALGNGIGQVLSIKRFSASKNSNWLTIFFGWALAIIAAVTISSYISRDLGASLNPAVATWQLLRESANLGFQTAIVIFLIRVSVSFLGAIAGQLIIDLLHFKELRGLENNVVLSTHCTVPNDKERHLRNFLNEVVATTIFVFAVASTSLLPAGTAVFTIGFVGAIIIAVFGATTGAAINPSRDLGPRLLFQILPLVESKKRDAMWSYSYIPVVAPFLGGALAGTIDLLLNL